MLREHPSIVLLFKSIIFSLLKTRTTSSFSPATSKVVVGFLILASQSHYVPGQLKLFLTMLLLKLKSIYSTFSLQSVSNMETHQNIFANYPRFAHSLLINLFLSIKNFVDFLKKYLSAFVFSFKNDLLLLLSLHMCSNSLLFCFCR